MSVWLGVALSLAGCQDGYPIAATRCDRLCDITRANACGTYSPAACVAGCEQQKVWGGVACYAALDAQLACLESHPAEIQPAEGNCGSSWDATIAECMDEQIALDLCRAAHAPHVPNSSALGGSGAE